MQLWWPFPGTTTNQQEMIHSLLKRKRPRGKAQITYAIFNATVYLIWQARNEVIFQQRQIPSAQLVRLIKEQLRLRILFLKTISNKYQTHIDRLSR